jgi:hypothetical protein
VSEVYDAPFSPNYNVVSKIDGSRHVANAYTSEMRIDDGWISFEVASKKKKLRNVGRPFHFLTKDGVLLAMKRYKHQVTNSFALNHELFALDWNISAVLHFVENTPMMFITSRDEWLHAGRVGLLGEELQISLEVPDYRLLPSNPLYEFHWWIKECRVAGHGRTSK